MDLPTFQQCYAILPEAMLILAADGEILAVNPAASALFRGKPAALQGLRLQALVVDPEPKLGHFLTQCQRSRELLPGALIARCFDGSTAACRAEAGLLVPHSEAQPGQILLRLLPKEATTSRFLALNERIESLNSEIAHRQRTEVEMVRTNEELRRVNSDLEQFAYSASHDLREPLRMVSIYSELLQRRYSGNLDAQAHEYLRICVEGARRMEALVADLLTYTQAVTPSDEPIVPVAPNEVINQVLSNLREAIKESCARVECAPLPKVTVRDVHLLQLFQNLISNALKYRAKEPPVIRITGQPEGAMWRISIYDNGLGIAAEYADEIFGLFKRLHTSDAYAGTGIGLAICEKIVHRYGGRIWVESEGEGKGSAFHLTLPGTNRDS
jgi:signal transduction histidine kinase